MPAVSRITRLLCSLWGKAAVYLETEEVRAEMCTGQVDASVGPHASLVETLSMVPVELAGHADLQVDIFSGQAGGCGEQTELQAAVETLALVQK